jgi:hypothetical protein
MKRFILFLLAVFCLVMSCNKDGNNEQNNGRTFGGAIPLSNDTWGNGNISPGEVQWFCFTPASDSNQLMIQFNREGMNEENVKIFYNNGGGPVEASYSSSSVPGYPLPITIYCEFSNYLDTGSTYYIKVSPNSDSDYGEYQIRYVLAVVLE